MKPTTRVTMETLESLAWMERRPIEVDAARDVAVLTTAYHVYEAALTAGAAAELRIAAAEACS